MKFQRVLTKDQGINSIKWKKVDVLITGKGGEVIFEQKAVEVPEHWSDNAASIIAQKYFRKAQVPATTVRTSKHEVADSKQPPGWLLPSIPQDPSVKTRGEVSARQVFHRMAGCWTYHGWHEGLISTEEDALIFYEEVFACLALQFAAPNSPQWFNTGLYWAYGIEGPDSGQWVARKVGDKLSVYQVHNSYVYPQPHACFIQTVEDDLVNPGGMMDLWTREARLFKHGSGTGSNFSKIRGKNEKLSGGGVSSGLMSFLRVGDRSAGSISSGGVTRRAAKMVVLDADHPEIEDFINWKAVEEHKAACIAVGSRVIHDLLEPVAGRSVRRVPRAGDKALNMVTALNAGVPQCLIDWALAGEPDWPVYDADSFEGPAIETVSGQNSNNSVRLSNIFMKKVHSGGMHQLIARTTGEVLKELPAKDLFMELCGATWACGDPGVQFDNTINDWHTCAADGRINASNPCSEYLHLDDTACNLASIRLTKFSPLTAEMIAIFEHVVRLWTVVLEISVYMASFPSEAIARNSYAYRTLGLGYADLGGLLMRMGIPYASEEGRSLAQALTSLMTVVAYKTSAEMALEVGPFSRWEHNKDGMKRVIRNHAKATLGPISADHYEGLSIEPVSYTSTSLTEKLGLTKRLDELWTGVTDAESFRNAQVTLLAPTGTISFVMDCDTTGIEPDFSLIKHKKLSGGGTMRIVNQAVQEVLEKLGYNAPSIEFILKQIEQNGRIPRTGNIQVYTNHADIFACAGDISPEDHIKMVAAVQPFLSGGISKTINFPNSATIHDIYDAYCLAHRLGVKSIAPFRDGSKLSQPLSSATSVTTVYQPVNLELPTVAEVQEQNGRLQRGEREYLPWRRKTAWKQKIKIGEYGQSVYLDVSEYEDGRPAEMFLEIDGQSPMLNSFADAMSIAVSIGLQYGVPAEKYVDKLVGMKFEPAGYVKGHDRIRFVSSIADYIGRELGITYCGREDLANVPSAVEEAVQRIAEVSDQADKQWQVLRDQSAVVAHAKVVRPGDDCPRCGQPMVRNGTCQTCPNCFLDGGCSG